jgi:hypothetical protein
VSAWLWRYEGYEPDDEKLREALCTLGNGVMATRGAAPEMPAGPHHYPGTYAAGVFNRLTSEVAGEAVDNECIVNLPNWLPLTFRAEGGRWFRIDEVEVLEHVQELDLRRAVLTRRLRLRDDDGRTTAVHQRRLVQHGDCATCAAWRPRSPPRTGPAHLEVRSGLDGTVARHRLVERYRDLRGEHLELVRARGSTDDDIGAAGRRARPSRRSASRWRRGPDTGDRRWLDQHRASTVAPCRRRRDAWIGQESCRSRWTSGTRSPSTRLVAVICTTRHAGHRRAGARGMSHAMGSLADTFDSPQLVARTTCWPGTASGPGSASSRGHDDSLRIVRLHTLHVLQTVSAQLRRPRRGCPRPRPARRGLPGPHLLGRAVRLPPAEPAHPVR